MARSKWFVIGARLGIIALLLWLFTDNSRLFAASQDYARSTTTRARPAAQGLDYGLSDPPASFDGDVRDLPVTATPALRAPINAPLYRTTPRPRAPQRITNDPTLQRAPGAAQALTQEQNFSGLDYNTWGDGWPPDTNGDVGPDYYIQAVNISLGIFNKQGTRLAAFKLDGLFNNAPYPCNHYNQGDPIVLYDQVSARWIAADFSWVNIDNGPYYECIAVSKTADPIAGGWWLYTFQADPNWLNDYAKLSIWADGIYMTANMYDLFGGGNYATAEGVRIWALNRNDLINGLPIHYYAHLLSTDYTSVLPSNLRGDLPPPGSPAYFASVVEPNQLHLWKFKVDWNTPGNTSFSDSTDLALPLFVMPCYGAYYINCIPELGGESIDGLGDRLMMQLQYRNINGTESLWMNHTIATDYALGQLTGVRWYEIRNPNGTPELRQAGTFQPDSSYRWMASLAVDKDGNMALGYSASSKTMYPAIRYTGRLASDPLNVLQAESSLIEGTGGQITYYSRWGDYSAMTIDPTDGCTFWYTNQYYITTGGNWQTRIGSFRFPQCASLSQIQKIFLPMLLR